MIGDEHTHRPALDPFAAQLQTAPPRMDRSLDQIFVDQDCAEAGDPEQRSASHTSMEIARERTARRERRDLIVRVALGGSYGSRAQADAEAVRADEARIEATFRAEQQRRNDEARQQREIESAEARRAYEEARLAAPCSVGDYEALLRRVEALEAAR